MQSMVYPPRGSGVESGMGTSVSGSWDDTSGRFIDWSAFEDIDFQTPDARRLFASCARNPVQEGTGLEGDA